MSLYELDAIKNYLHIHLVKVFIKASSALYLSLVLFIKKLSRKIRFFIDYQNLNAITNND